MILAPRGDLPRLTLMLRVSLDPRQYIPVAAALGEFLLQGFVVEADEVEKMPVHSLPTVMVFPQLPGDGRARLVEDAWQQDVSAQPHTRTARRALGEIGRGNSGAHIGLTGAEDVVFQRIPPEIKRVSPVTHPESSEAKKAATLPISWGWPMRPSGVWATICLGNSVSKKPAA